ncbi:disease resistance protein RPV1-like isoform X2 [Cornus florida]|uniref:disease resistance protein RPV1-like isoform X2 n=1 Tax=Cornus florida TaxID=4283 RepID=UPI00289933F2|nr:disease resistance protein RPV1-like isoform X2 [Cornus florida]
MVVQTVLLELKKNCMVLTDNLVGISEHINEMMRLLKVGSNDTRIVGIYGMGGIGKTTIAKCIYKKLVCCFECCSFLENIQKATPHKGLVSLQKRLAHGTLKSCPDIIDVNSGIDIIKQRFLNKKVLIVLDDLNEKSQFDYLVRNCEFYGRGSRIIVTTRDKHCLNVIQVDATYEPPFMNSVQSLQLFSMHAFRKKFPPKDFDDISKKVASFAAGLPLTLEVIGSFLSDKTKVVWEYTLKKLKKLPANKVQEREIVREEDRQNPGGRSRLWDRKEALDVLKECRGTKKVEVLSLKLLYNDMSLTCREFRKLFNLRYLQVDSGNFVGDFKHHFSQLRWLCWKKCPHDFEAIHFHMKNLVVLDLSYSSITENWEGWSQIEMSNKLKVLNLTNCNLRRTPDFSANASLEILILDHCGKLVEIDPSIGNLKNLRVLNISWSKIRNLPDEIWMLEKLEVIDASGCSCLEGNIPIGIGRFSSLRHSSLIHTKIQSLPTSICELSCLQTLDLDFCIKLEVVPDLPSSLEILKVKHFGSRNLRVTPSVANLVNLQELGFSGLRGYVELSRDIEKFTKLQVLMLDHSNIRTLPKGIDALSRLKILTVRSCDDLQCILGLPSSLVELSLEYCVSMERLPDLSNLKKL